MKYIHLATILSVFIWFGACSDSSIEQDPGLGNNNPGNNNPSPNEWLIPSDQVFDGGPGKDGIPSIDDPREENFTKASEVDFLSPEELVLGIRSGNEIKAYPHQILDWHEITNDQIGNLSFAVTYCPLTGTGIGWNRIINGNETTFGVSGLLYNTNLMPYDRMTNSTWSQQRLDCVHGELIGRDAVTYTLLETTWATWRAAYPESKVLNRNTGFNRRYGVYPYTDYKVNQNRLLFPISTKDNRLPFKERTLGVLLDGNQKVYTFPPNTGLEVMEDNLGGTELIIVRDRGRNFMVAFRKPLDLTLEATDQFPVILRDNNGVEYDVLGVPTNGELSSRLEMPTQFMGFWFSWGTFYPGIELHQD